MSITNPTKPSELVNLLFFTPMSLLFQLLILSYVMRPESINLFGAQVTNKGSIIAVIVIAIILIIKKAMKEGILLAYRTIKYEHGNQALSVLCIVQLISILFFLTSYDTVTANVGAMSLMFALSFLPPIEYLAITFMNMVKR